MTRTEDIRLKVSPEEKAAIKAYAETQHLAFSSWARKVLLDTIKKTTNQPLPD